RLPLWSGGKLRFALDMHCPSISDQAIYLVGGPDEQIWKELGRFSTILETNQSSPLVYRSKDNLPIDKAWNTRAIGRKSFSRWGATLPGMAVATCIEVPYASVAGKPVTDQSARVLGHDVARALRRYLAPPAD